MDKEKVEQVLKELNELVENNVGANPSDIDRWIDLLTQALKEGGN